jgi:predicted  nucleic acid-binding Zn-ribbon protein
LNKEADCPEGLPEDVWQRLVEIRDRKIGTENDVRSTQRHFNEMQALVQAVVDESDRIRNETEKVSIALSEFIEYKFLSTYNVESLFQLKQGQVEVPQAPVVTDYSDAALIHRNVVEKLNESIQAMGRAKVEALVEIKDYRKGIHALEWYVIAWKEEVSRRED